MARNTNIVEVGPGAHHGAPARVLIVDDSVVARSVIGRMIEGTRHFTVAGAVSDARAALTFLTRHDVEIILLDIEMPGVDGLTALPDLLAAGRGAKVLIVSSSAEEGAAATVQALALGAADTLVKPGVGAFGGRFAEVLEERLERLMEPHAETAPSLPTSTVPALHDDFDIVAIGASTGGIHALSQLLRAIPQSFQVPILVTQHLPPSFMSFFAAQLAVLGSRPCDVAAECMRIRPGRIIVAPGTAHMRVVRTSEGTAIRLTEERCTSGCMPSVDPMFESIAEVYGARALGIVLSGMGRDGSEGAARLVDAGARIVVQDRESSVVWGMPGSVASAGRASAVLPPEEIGKLVASRRRPS
ncbi:chemotaxis-specific protein-glutamate methyltransferase CheB [Sphingomonas sp.]|uniref:chemotaxis-specific protein-glutamate methyltransferase CheB n=1 Tax=Sphingomonas sp. TaxID=28214 RepID=UPI001B10A68B|nr:chemotaxis-specific protein-glutamate methyltransferase CheB [Sphingomonas sp.]MBO9712949.1 chemotaxis-specific protein-glutamate methyltransferase CheB [Sphingomonas sp.]